MDAHAGISGYGSTSELNFPRINQLIDFIEKDYFAAVAVDQIEVRKSATNPMLITVVMLGVRSMRDIKSHLYSLTLLCRLQPFISINWLGV